MAHTVEVPVSSLTSGQLQDQLNIRGIVPVGSPSEMQQQLVSALSRSGFKRKRGGSEAVTKLNTAHLQDDIDAYISASTAPITLSDFLELVSIIREPTVFGEAHLLAASALAHNFWSTMGLIIEESREEFLYSFEEPGQIITSLPCDPAVMDMQLSDIALRLDRVQLMMSGDPCIAEKLQFLQVEMGIGCSRAADPRPPALKLQEYPRLLQPLKVSADPPISSLVPFLVALRKAGAVDATLGCGASPTERAEAVCLEALFVSWVDRHPWVDIFLGSA